MSPHPIKQQTPPKLRLGRLVAFAVAAVMLAPAYGKVTTRLNLCSPPSGAWMTSHAEKKIHAFAAQSKEVAHQFGPPEIAITTSVQAGPGGTGSRATLEVERSILHRLRTLGLVIDDHAALPAPRAAQPEDFGCKANEIAIEIELIFKHPRL